jgi:hypothetical protein
VKSAIVKRAEIAGRIFRNPLPEDATPQLARIFHQRKR